MTDRDTYLDKTVLFRWDSGTVQTLWLSERDEDPAS